MALIPITHVTSLPIWQHGALAAVTFGYFQWIKGKLDASYTASQHPVDYATGQTSFSAETIKGYYAVMQDASSLDLYVRTQIIDFGFILALACIGAFFCTFIARAARPGSIGRRIGIVAGLLIIIGAVCDAIENGISFIMLANPTGFADWLALPYSGFASIKFALIALGMLLLVLCLLSALTGRVLCKPRIG